jgi:uncharacterized membrane protein
MESVERTFDFNDRFSSTTHPDNRAQHSREINVHDSERIASALGGGVLTVLGLTKGGLGGWALALLGGGLAWRGLTGHCDIYGALKINTAHQGKHAGVRHGEGIKVEKSVTINKAPEEIYRFWHNFENLPRFMNHLEAVRVLDDKRSHWTAKAPLGTTAEWDAEIINEKENELIAWRSVEGSSIPNAGSVRFEQKPGAAETVVRVSISYEPPGGTLGALLAKLFGEEPEQQIAEDLRRFKQVMEAGETASTQGQPSGRSLASGARSGR